jgi:hypothetical protein
VPDDDALRLFHHLTDTTQPPGQTQAYKLIDGGYEIITKLNGKVMTTNRFQVSRDGGTITQTVTGNDVQTGQKVNHTVVWEKQ